MVQTTDFVKGGSFLIEDVDLEKVFTPEDFSDEHLMIAKTTEEYVENEVLPVFDKLENHEFEYSVELMKKQGNWDSFPQTSRKNMAALAWIKSLPR